MFENHLNLNINFTCNSHGKILREFHFTRISLTRISRELHVIEHGASREIHMKLCLFEFHFIFTKTGCLFISRGLYIFLYFHSLIRTPIFFLQLSTQSTHVYCSPFFGRCTFVQNIHVIVIAKGLNQRQKKEVKTKIILQMMDAVLGKKNIYIYIYNYIYI